MRRRPLTTTVAVICWLLAAGLIALELIRLAGLDEHATLLIAVSTAWPVVALPGLVVVIGALVLRWKSLGAVAIGCMIILVAAWWPTWTGAAGSGASNTARIRVIALNVEYSQGTGAATSRQIRANNPDVVVLSELSPRNQQHLDLHQYRYSWQRPQSTAFGQGVWSRWALTDATTWSDSGVTMAILTVHSPSGAFRLFQVHTRSPTGAGGRPRWKSQLQHLHARLAAERLPLVAAGDFNASHWDSAFTELLGGRNHVADAGAGRGYLATWPSGKKWIPPVLPLDHVLISRGIGVRGIKVLGPIGSDHRGLLADLTMSAAANS